MKYWFKYVKPYLLYFILGPLGMITEVVGEVVLPYLFAIVINKANDGTLTVEGSLGIMVLMILTAAVMMTGGVAGAYFGAKASVNFAADLRADCFAKVQTYSFSNIDKFSTGSLVTRLTNDVTQLQNFVNMLLRMALRSPGMLIAGLVMAIALKPSLSTVLAVSIPVLLIAIGSIVVTGFRRFGLMQKKIDGLNSTVQESVTNVRVVKSFVREEYETEKFRTANRDLKTAGMSAMKIMIFMQPIITLVMNITVLTVIWLGGGIVLEGDMQVGDLSAFISYTTQILSSLMMVTMLLMFSSRALASAKRVREVLDETVDLDDSSAKYPDLTVQKGEIEFKNVSFRYYKNSEGTVLDSIDLKIPAGSTVGIIGSTGCGKTTLVSLIPRLYDTDEGEVLIDGINVKDYSLYHLREGVGMVLQKNTLFSGSVAENLRWGNPDATDEELIAAAEHSKAHGFVSAFTDGYDYMIEQGGTNLSGGQRQRLSIARTLLKKPKIIILDDSTSAVDTATEREIQRAFREDLAGSTKIIIAQRIGSVKDADTVIVMNEGKIAAVGKHDELLATSVDYREIYESQADSHKEALAEKEGE